MPGLVEVAYTIGGGVVGAALTNYVAKIQDRRQLRAEVYRHLAKVREISGGVRTVEVGVAPRSSPGGRRRSIAMELGVTALLDGGADGYRALREALADLMTAVLVAGMPRRVADFAGGAHERLLDSTLMVTIDRCLGGVLGADADRLVRATQEYQAAATALLLAVLWHPWRARLRLRHRMSALRIEVESLHRLQQNVLVELTREEHVTVLYEHLDPDGQRRKAWGLEKQGAAS
ncbi:hypothetical protein [Amycolatopsis australiensis]|uniref:Uncharacterized protein n=1 Tax=Amycolatopsis australiensis TaxID=546364 RepID=A0A1K1SS33_9PSEU|nr:hypothetical protein [Amycolatopsis australiensis]SFW87028.1 hypothetical protein SAMN04489730_6573 [Amycolatopsis australiensis]